MVQTLTREHNKLHRSVLIRSNSLAHLTLVNVRILENFLNKILNYMTLRIVVLLLGYNITSTLKL